MSLTLGEPMFELHSHTYSGKFSRVANDRGVSSWSEVARPFEADNVVPALFMSLPTCCRCF